jgi:putative ABC transport system substrate-binding protein
MRRRDFIAGLVVAAATGRAQAQQSAKVYRIAIVDPSVPLTGMRESPVLARALEELRRLGWVEGQNLRVELYSSEGRAFHDPDLAREVARSNPDVIVAISNPLVLDFKAATTSIPIVGVTADPVALGIVASLARPGGNITGVSVDAGIDIWAKRLDLLRGSGTQGIQDGVSRIEVCLGRLLRGSTA